MITNISASNLKGRSFNLPLSQRVYITGKNFSGKTAIIEAIRLGLLGHIPEIGKRNADAFELSNASRMEIELSLDTAPGRVARAFWMEKGSVKMSMTDATGISPELATLPILDSAAYFNMTSTQQVDYVFQRVTMPPEFTVAGVVSDLHKLSLGEEHTEQVEEAKRDVIAICENVIGRERGDLRKALGLLIAIDLADEYKKWNARAKDSAGAVRTLTELKLREDECSAVTLTDLRNELARIDGLINEASGEHGRLTQLQTQAVSVRERRREISAALNAEAPSTDVPEPPELIDIVLLKKAFDEATVALGKLAIPPENVDVAMHTLAGTARQVKALRDQLFREHAAKQVEINDIAAQTCCPTCKRKAKGWQKEVVATLENELADLNQKLVAAEAELSKANVDAKAGEEAVAVAVQKRNAILLATAEQQRLEREISRAQLKNEQDQRAYERMVEAIKSARATFDTKQESLRGELTRLVEVAPPTESEMEASRAKMAELATARTAARDKTRVAEALLHDIKRAEQAAEEHGKTATKATVIKAVGVLLKEKKGEMVAVAFNELLTTANNLVGDILPAPLAYNEDGGDVGYWGASGFVTHRTMSGTERALCYVAVAAALASTAPLRLVIIDELARLTPMLQDKVLTSLSAAIDRKELDQCIVVVPSDDGSARVPSEAWQIVRTPLEK